MNKLSRFLDEDKQQVAKDANDKLKKAKNNLTTIKEKNEENEQEKGLIKIGGLQPK